MEASVSDLIDMSLGSLRHFYKSGARPRDVMALVKARIASRPAAHAWIHVADDDQLRATASKLEHRQKAGEALPLFGIPFGVKDNIDVVGMPTTAACPDFSYVPSQSATSVEHLVRAGAICIGKTNLDQFATGLSGTRSPYGACASFVNPTYVSGGSSSGSAVAVAAGHVSFALGTDTGGSGRIPAGFNGIVGIKPTVGRVSSRGLVPNCPSIDCVSIFSGTVSDGTEILSFLDGFDADDPYSRRPPAMPDIDASPSSSFRFGRLRAGQIESFGMAECVALYEAACQRLERMGGRACEIDFDPFIEAGQMLFGGPWIAERRASLEPFVTENAHALLDVIAQVIDDADRYSAVNVFSGLRRLQHLRRDVETLFRDLETIVVPTAPRPFTVEAMLENAVELNTQLGYYSHGVNLLDLCGVAVPNAVLSCGAPMGVTFLGPAWHDEKLCRLAERFEREKACGAGPAPADG
jgi:amidase/allophanate hydrolase